MKVILKVNSWSGQIIEKFLFTSIPIKKEKSTEDLSHLKQWGFFEMSQMLSELSWVLAVVWALVAVLVWLVEIDPSQSTCEVTLQRME